MKFIKKAKRGFTLVELVVVIAVIAILAAVSVGAYFGITESANKSKLESEARGVHTNIQLIAQNGGTEWNIDRNGLYIKDLDSFVAKLLEYSGIDYDVKAGGDITTIANPTIYFFNKTPESSERLVKERFNSFKYYSPEVGNKRASVDIVSGEVTIEDVTFNVGEPDPVVVNSINFADIEDEINLIVTDTQTFSVVSDPEDISYGFRNYDDSVISVSNNTIKALGAGTTTLEVYSRDDETKFDSISVRVDPIKMNETLIVKGLETFKKNYFENESITLDDLDFEISFNKGENQVADKSKITFSPAKFSSSDTSVTFTFTDVNLGTASYTATGFVVTPKALDSITASVSTIDTSTYFAGDDLDISDIGFTAVYNNGDEESISYENISYESKLVAGQANITFTYNSKTLDVGFSHTIPAVVLDRLQVEAGLEATTVYEVGTTEISKDDLTFTAVYNNGDEEIISHEDISIVTTEITKDTSAVVFSYTEGEITKYVELSITVTDHEELYFIDQSWWSPDGAVPYIKLYDANQNFVRVDGIGVPMELVPNTLSPLTASQVYKTNIDTMGAKYIQIFRANTNGDFINAKTELIDIDSMTGNGILLTTTATRNDNNNAMAEVEFVDYTNEFHKNVHLVGLDGWEHTETNKFDYEPQSKTYTLKDVNLEYHSEFLFKEVVGNGEKEEFNSLVKFSSIKDRVTNEGFDISSGSNDNIKVGHVAAGVYDIVISSGKITFTKTSENFDIELRGVFKGVNRWTTNPISYTSRNANIFVFENVELEENDEFKVYASDYSGFDYGFTNVRTNENNRFQSNNGNIKLKGVDGVYTITVDIAANKIDIDEISGEHKCRYSGHICANCGKGETGYLFLKPGTNWKQANARFAAYFFGNGDSWSSMIDSNGDGIYEVAKASGYTSIIFVRMNPNNQTNNWDNKWTQTVDLTIPTSNNCYTISNSASTDGNIKASGSWSKL